jgi:hypothetical protein
MFPADEQARQASKQKYVSHGKKGGPLGRT